MHACNVAGNEAAGHSSAKPHRIRVVATLKIIMWPG